MKILNDLIINKEYEVKVNDIDRTSITKTENELLVFMYIEEPESIHIQNFKYMSKNIQKQIIKSLEKDL